jgi:glycosyltransferase involved in cell wall biosynthesis
MACGTPVAALRLGAVPEIVDDGATGFAVSTLDELAAVIPRACALDRRQIRAVAEQRFSATQMARSYAAAYQRLAAVR